MKRCWFAAAILCSSGVSFAAPGALDTTFNGTGTLTTPIGASNDVGNAVALQPDGKLVVAGYTHNGFNYDFALARYNTDGTLDTTFDGDGKVITPGGLDEVGRSIAVQPDGKIVVAGANNYVDFVLMRYNPDGSLDATFDGDGQVATPFGANSAGNALALQPDGKIVAAGYSFTGAKYDFALARYNSDGSLDTTFDGDGKVTTPIGASADTGYAVALQPDGKIVVAGQSYNGGIRDFALARYNSDGSLDTTFDGDGRVTTRFGAAQSLAWSVALQPDGKLVAAGFCQNGTVYDFALARYNSDGSLDTTFDGDGKVTTPFGSTILDYSNALALQPDGQIVVAGYGASASYDFVLARYHGDGSLDTTFDGDGKVITPIGTVDIGSAIALQPDGKLAVAGFSSNNGTIDFALARYVATDTAWDLTPTAPGFTDQIDVPLGSTRTSNLISIDGLDAGVKVPLQISGGSYSLNGGAYTTDLGWVQNGDTIVVRHTASSAFSTATNTTLTVGGLVAANNATVMLGGTVSDVFTSTTGKAIPDPFSFTDITSQALNSTVTSDAITVTGSAMAVEISVIGGEYSIGCTSSFTTASGTILPGETVCVRHTTASSYSTTVDTTLTIGGVSDIFSSTTEVAPTSSADNGTSSSTASNTKSGGGAFDPLMALGALAAFGLRRRRAKAE